MPILKVDTDSSLERGVGKGSFSCSMYSLNMATQKDMQLTQTKQRLSNVADTT